MTQHFTDFASGGYAGNWAARTRTQPAARKTIPVSSADLRGNELAYVSDCIASGWLTQGPYVERFEAELARVTGARYALACSSGTAALHLAMLAAGVGPDSTVIVPALTYVATANAAVYCGARVVFADVGRFDWCMSHETACKAAGKLETCGELFVLPVDLFDSKSEVGQNNTHTALRDSAHSMFQGNSDVVALSFYASKIAACGEGGAVLTNDDELNDTIYKLRGQGATSRRYYHDLIGFNYRMTDLQAAVGLAQLERLDEMLAARRRTYNLYCGTLRVAGFLEIGGELQGGERSSAWTFACLLPPDVNRDLIISRLSDHNIESRPFFVPLNELSMYRDSSGPPTPVAAEVSRRGICLPLYSGIADSDVEYVCERLMAEVAR
jgi:perosamine synthetase